MLLSKKVSLSRILSGTWKPLIFDIITCVASYLLFIFVLKGNFALPALVPTILGTALSFFIGFNNNQAYDRWWEARKIWGALVNDSRTWARQIMSYTHTSSQVDESELRSMRSKAIYRHVAFLYALKQNLRRSDNDEYRAHLNEEDMKKVADSTNRANAILSLQSASLDDMYRSGVLDGFRFIELNQMNVNFCNEMGKSERIFNTVFPTTYNYYTRVFVWVFIVTVTIVSAEYLGAWSVLVGTLVGYVFLTTHKIGSALLNPFDDIPTGIALNQITRTIERNILETLGEQNLPRPVEPIEGDYVM